MYSVIYHNRYETHRKRLVFGAWRVRLAMRDWAGVLCHGRSIYTHSIYAHSITLSRDRLPEPFDLQNIRSRMHGQNAFLS